MPKTHKVTIIAGDGIGLEITNQVIRVLKAVDAPLEYIDRPAGLHCLNSRGELLPKETIDSIRETKLALKGPTTTPVGTGHKSINVQMRQMFDLYANVRPIRTLPGVKTPFPDINLVIVRENTEDLYIGDERWVDDDTAESIKRLSRKGCTRISKYGFDLAKARGFTRVACAHKANIMKLTDGLFLNCFREQARAFPQVESRDVIIDNCCMQLVTKPQQFQVIVTENLYGDILSDLCAGLVGGLGVVPGANIGNNEAIFEAVHGSAPDIAGQYKANPTALLQSAIMMLQHIGEDEKANRMTYALHRTLADTEIRTPDLGGKGTTITFTDAIIANLG